MSNSTAYSWRVTFSKTFHAGNLAGLTVRDQTCRFCSFHDAEDYVSRLRTGRGRGFTIDNVQFSQIQ